jgi:hypothetical protein
MIKVNKGGKVRAWSTPLTIGSFVLSALTGIMIFFHWGFTYAKVLHEWLGWLLVFGASFHVVGNWRPFVRYFSYIPGKASSGVSGKAIMAVFAVLIAVSFVPSGGKPDGPDGPGGHGGPGRAMPARRLEGLISRTPFVTVAGIAVHEPEGLIRELRRQGVVIERKEQTIQEIAARNGRANVEILNLIF